MSPDVLKQLEWLVQPHTGSVPALYDEVAPLYESFRAQWLALAGARTEEAMVQDLAAVLRSGDRVLDAGCGTGAMSRTILELQPDVDLTLVDASEAMLERAGELGSRRMVGDVADLPFEEGSFDVITCAWVIETVPDPAAAATELLRVLDPDGFLLVSFCTLPDGWLSRAGRGAIPDSRGRERRCTDLQVARSESSDAVAAR